MLTRLNGATAARHNQNMYPAPRSPSSATLASMQLYAAWCCCALWLGTTGPAWGDDLPRHGSGSAHELSRLIADLGHEDFSLRRLAQQRIIAHGADAIDPVAGAIRSADREVQGRAAAILRHFAEARQRDTRLAARTALQRLASDPDAKLARVGANALQVLQQVAALKIRQRGGETAQDMGQVVSVNYSSCQITDDDLLPLLQFPALRQLDLRFTPVTNAGLEYLEELSELEVCNLQGTSVTDAGLASIAHLTKLKSFSVERTQVSDLGLVHLKKLPRLETLYLGGCQVAGPGLNELVDLPISYLSFQDSKINDHVVEGIVKLKRLKTLGLDDTPVTNACLARLRALEELEVLWLDSSKVTNDAIDDLTALGKLQRLHLRNTAVTPDGYEKLKKRMPQTHIYYSELRAERGR